MSVVLSANSNGHIILNIYLENTEKPVKYNFTGFSVFIITSDGKK
jgi:hypothetical protein